MRHYRLRNICFAHLRWMTRQNNLPFNNSTDVVNFDKVVYAACEFGKAPKRPYGATKTNPR